MKCNQEQKLRRKTVRRVEDGREPEPECQDHAEHLRYIPHKYIQAGNKPGYSQSEEHQEKKINGNKKDEYAHLAQDEKYDAKKNGKSDQMIYKTGQQDDQREYFAREQGLGHKIGIIDNNGARSLKGILEKKPGQDAAEKKKRKAGRSRIRLRPESEI